MRIALGLEYDGTAYNGWQRQRNGTGVQSRVEDAIAVVANQQVEVTCAGRTDAGVHAAAQVAHFDAAASRTDREWLLGLNTNLPPDINVVWAKAVTDEFHARFSATSRSYRYLILNRLARSSLYRHRAWWIHRPLNVESMREAARHLIGEHDFSAFRAAGCQASTPHREVTDIHVDRHAEWIAIIVSANTARPDPGWRNRAATGSDLDRRGISGSVLDTGLFRL
jgi:tRNA pseudouridine38-40 synthase